MSSVRMMYAGVVDERLWRRSLIYTEYTYSLYIDGFFISVFLLVGYRCTRGCGNDLISTFISLDTFFVGDTQEKLWQGSRISTVMLDVHPARTRHHGKDPTRILQYINGLFLYLIPDTRYTGPEVSWMAQRSSRGVNKYC